MAAVGLASLAVHRGSDLGRGRRGRRAGDLLMNRLELTSLDVARPEVRDEAVRKIPVR